jgi:hypothetical protein
LLEADACHHHKGWRVAGLGELGRFTSKDGCPFTAAIEDVPVRMVHPPTAMVIVKIAKMVAIVAGNRIVSSEMAAAANELNAKSPYDACMLPWFREA